MKRKLDVKKSAGIMLAVVAQFLVVTLPPVFAAEPINICLTTDFSSTGAVFGVQEAPVVEMVVNDVNAAGGINGRQLKLIVQDSASDPSKAIGIAKMFKENYKCKVIIAPVISSVGTALKAWAEKNQIVVMASDPASDRLLDTSPRSWMFRTEVPASLRITASLSRMKKLGYTKVAFEGSTLAWGADSLAVLKGKAPGYGIKIVAETLVEPKTKDLTIQAKKLKESGAQAIVCADYEAETGVFARALKGIAWKPYVFHVSSSTYTNTLSTNPVELFEEWETVQTIDISKPLLKKLWKKVAAYTGKTMIEDEKIPRVWDATNLVLEAIKASGNPNDSKAIRDALYGLKNYERVIGHRSGKGGFTEGKNHLLDINELIPYTTKSGKLVPVKL